MYYFHKTPRFLQFFFPNYIWRKKTAEKTIYLTFDDGPTIGVTDWVLETLSNYNAKATFFCLGKNLDQHRKIVDRIVKSSHRIANHSYTHVKGWQTNNSHYVNDVERAQKLLDVLLKKSNTEDAKYFRPPYGRIGYWQSVLLRKRGFQIVMWEILSGDYDESLNTEKAITALLKHTKNGSIIVFHDSVKAFNNLKELLPRLLQNWQDKGYKFEVL